MSGYVDLFFSDFLVYLNLFFTSEIIKYMLSIFIVLAVLGLLRKLIHVAR